MKPRARSRFFPQRPAGPTRSSYFRPSGVVQDDTGVAGGGGYSENRKVRARERRRGRSCGESRGSGSAVDIARAKEIEDQAPDHGAESGPLTGVSEMEGKGWIRSSVTDVPVGDEPSREPLPPPPPPPPPPPASMKRKRGSTVEIGTANCAGSVCIGPQHAGGEISGAQSEQPGNQQGKRDRRRDMLTRGGRGDTPGDFIVKELRTRSVIVLDGSKERVLQRYGRSSAPANGAQLGGTTSAQPRGKVNPASNLGNSTIPGEVCPGLAEQVPDAEKEAPVQSVRRSPRKRMKRTGKVSSYFSSSAVQQARRIRKEQIKCGKARVPAGVSVIPQPPLTAKTFGLIQEELENNAYYVIVAAVFLTKTRGATAVPLLRQFLIDYPSPMALSQGNLETLTAFLRPLGLHRVRANRLIQMGKTWIEQPPTPGVGTRKCNYPARDTRPFDFPCPLLGGVGGQPRLGVERNCVWEIAHLPGVGAYALDCWRIFCLDRFRRGAAELREKEREAEEHEEDGGREWMRVVPKDKELRAYLRWRWAKEGWAECEQLAK